MATQSLPTVQTTITTNDFIPEQNELVFAPGGNTSLGFLVDSNNNGVPDVGDSYVPRGNILPNKNDLKSTLWTMELVGYVKKQDVNSYLQSLQPQEINRDDFLTQSLGVQDIIIGAPAAIVMGGVELVSEIDSGLQELASEIADTASGYNPEEYKIADAQSSFTYDPTIGPLSGDMSPAPGRHLDNKKDFNGLIDTSSYEVMAAGLDERQMFEMMRCLQNRVILDQLASLPQFQDIKNILMEIGEEIDLATPMGRTKPQTLAEQSEMELWIASEPMKRAYTELATELNKFIRNITQPNCDREALIASLREAVTDFKISIAEFVESNKSRLTEFSYRNNLKEIMGQLLNESRGMPGAGKGIYVLVGLTVLAVGAAYYFYTKNK